MNIKRHFFGGPMHNRTAHVAEDQLTFCAFGHSDACIYVLRRVGIKSRDRRSVVEAFVPADEKPEKYRECFMELASPAGRAFKDFLHGLGYI